MLAASLALAGVALRWSELGAFGLSNDEAWVALATRVEGPAQRWLAIAMTPVGWAGLVVLAERALGSSELALRSVPFAFGCLTLWAAHRAGRRFAGHALGGVLALAVVAFEPLGIAYAKVLKQYTAEAFLCLLALDGAAAWARSGRRRDLVALALVLAGGLAFANAQLFLGPPVLVALLADALVRRDRARVRAVLVTAAGVGVVHLLHYRFVLGPRLPAALDPYWSAQVYLPARPIEAAGILWERLGWTLRPALGGYGVVAAMLALVVSAAAPRRRVAALALALLVSELAVLSMLGIVAVSQPRILVFATTALAAYGAAAVAALAVRATRGTATTAAATLALALLVHDFVRAHPWRALLRAAQVEDAGPLVREMERDAAPDDAILLHQTTLFIYGWYQRATPVLDRLPISVGYVPRAVDPRVTLVNDADAVRRAEEALARSPRVWFLASRLRAPREQRLREGLLRVATPVRERRRPGALLLLLSRRPGPAG